MRPRAGSDARAGAGVTTIPDPPSCPDVGAWDAALTRLENELALLASALDAGGRPPTTAWTPPTDIGPLPSTLRDRATELLAHLEDLTDELRDARSATLGEAQRTRLHRDAAAAYHGIARGTDRYGTA